MLKLIGRKKYYLLMILKGILKI